jgi:NADPH:quinone reductase-like Zn-dependent oxidoreductase
MKALRVHHQGDPSSLVIEEVPQPQPSAGELLVRVYAAGVTPSELGWYPTSHTSAGADRTLPIPGHEFSGVVEALGEGVTGVSVGDEVYGLNDWFGDGAMAEYCLVRATDVAGKPKVLTHAQAACVPIAALTAWQGLIERAGLSSGESVLIHGAAGAVGVFAIQLAKWRGARIFATASSANSDFVRELGADEVIDYHAAPFERKARDLDVVFDTVGGDTLERSWSVLKPDGRMVTIAASVAAEQDPRVKNAFFIVEPNRARLGQITSLIEEKRLQPVVEGVLPLERAAEAFAPRTGGKVHRGKTAIQIA